MIYLTLRRMLIRTQLKKHLKRLLCKPIQIKEELMSSFRWLMKHFKFSMIQLKGQNTIEIWKSMEWKMVKVWKQIRNFKGKAAWMQRIKLQEVPHTQIKQDQVHHRLAFNKSKNLRKSKYQITLNHLQWKRSKTY
jgi:hypothetical protein